MADFIDLYAIASRLKEYYSKDLGISAKEFSELTGISQTMLSSINTGKTNKINVDSINKAVASCDGLDGYWLLFGDNQPKGSSPDTERTDLFSTHEVEQGENPTLRMLLNKVEEQAALIHDLQRQITLQGEEREIEEIKVYFSDGSYRNYSAAEHK